VSERNVGNIPQTEADEDVDRDVLIAEDEERRTAQRRSARQRIEDMRERCE
jgi:hypothetical protein